MSPTVPTTTDSRDEDNDDPGWICRCRPSLITRNVRHHGVALSNFVPTPVGVDQSTQRQQQQQQQQQEDCEREDRRRLFGWISRDPQEGITDAYDGLVTVIGNKGEDAENGDCWLMSHQSSSSALKGATAKTMTGSGVGNRQEHEQEQTIKTTEFWIHQLRSVLNETRSNLSLIVAFHQRQMQQQTKQPTSPDATKAEDSLRAIIRSSKSVAVQTDFLALTNNAAATTGVTGAAVSPVNDETKLNYYRKSVSRRSRDDHVAGGSLIEKLSPSSLHSAALHNVAAAKASNVGGVGGKVLCLDSLADGDDGCHFIHRASNSCCPLSAHSCRAANKQHILSATSSYSGRMKRTIRDRIRKLEDQQQERETNQRAYRCDTTAILLLNEAWQLAGLHSRQRMSILSRHYRILYKNHRRLRRRHRRLRRTCQRTRRRHLYVQLQLQILLESIGTQVDDVASDWVDRLKGLLKLQAFTAREPTASATDGLMGAPSHPDDSYPPFNPTGHRQKQQQQQRQQFRVNGGQDDGYSFSLYRWYSSLSLKLGWLRTSHRTVIENLLLFQRIPGT